MKIITKFLTQLIILFTLFFYGCDSSSKNRTEILWDKFGVSHIFAHEYDKLFYSFGKDQEFDKKVINNKIILPHPRMHTRNFVLLPLFQVNKDWVHPISKYHIKRLILSLSKRDITSIKQI